MGASADGNSRLPRRMIDDMRMCSTTESVIPLILVIVDLSLHWTRHYQMHFINVPPLRPIEFRQSATLDK